jgi:hypothetical protein
METVELPDLGDSDISLDSDRGSQFVTQLRTSHQAAVVLLQLLRAWQQLGGRLSFGRASETSCFLILDADRPYDATIWPFAIYPKNCRGFSSICVVAPSSMTSPCETNFASG